MKTEPFRKIRTARQKCGVRGIARHSVRSSRAAAVEYVLRPENFNRVAAEHVGGLGWRRVTRSAAVVGRPLVLGSVCLTGGRGRARRRWSVWGNRLVRLGDQRLDRAPIISSIVQVSQEHVDGRRSARLTRSAGAAWRGTVPAGRR